MRATLEVEGLATMVHGLGLLALMLMVNGSIVTGAILLLGAFIRRIARWVDDGEAGATGALRDALPSADPNQPILTGKK